MTSSVPTTPRSYNVTTPSRTPRRLVRRSYVPPETPESTPSASSETSINKRRVSKEERKNNEISNVLTVAVRIRPMNSRELSNTTVYDTITVNNNELILKILPPVGLGLTHSFQYDHVFYSTDSTKEGYASQKDVFLAIGEPMLDNAFKGYNACLFAYGQTGSGKSYSMMGEHCNIDTEDSQTAGIIPRFCYDLFKRISELPSTSCATVEVSYFEIYNEKIYDLLAIAPAALERRTPLKVREHPVLGPYVVNLSPHIAKSYNELRNLLQLGNKYRATAATVINEKSSRSHSIVSIELSICEISNEGTDSGRRSKISLVDLAGSERVGNSNSNDDRHREGVSINQSLLTLGKVIAALADSKKSNNFIPYRESILTWLLRESLGGNSLTAMLATITPASSHTDETLATLRYACQARSIVNRAYVNENPHDRLIRELRAELDRLRALRQDYERHSITPISYSNENRSINNSNDNKSVNLSNDNSLQELEELRQRLTETEKCLEDARKAWEQRLLETKQKQLQELAEAERRKEELESHVRVMSTLDQEMHLSPYKSNFLEQLENVLENEKENIDNHYQLVDETNKWCELNNLKIIFCVDKNTDNIIVKNLINKMYARCNTRHLESRFHYNDYPEDFLNCLEWQAEKMSKNTVQKYFQQIQNATIALQPITNDDENLKLVYAQLNQALQTFEMALNKSKYRVRHNKTVKFQT